MSEYPIGTTWKGTGNNGRCAYIWLEKRSPSGNEIWRWTWHYSDGSHGWNSGDWDTSYRACKERIPFVCRMKRVKKDEERGE